MVPLPGTVAHLTVLLAAVVAFVSGCTPITQIAGPADREAQNYHDQVDAQTRAVTLYDRFDTRALVKATLLSDSFLATWCAEYARVHHLEVHGEGICEEARDRFGQGVPVIVHLETPEPGEANLDPRQGIWTTTLSSDQGVSVAPYQVTRVESPSVEDRYFFPYIESFGRTYLLKFPPKVGWSPGETAPGSGRVDGAATDREPSKKDAGPVGAPGEAAEARGNDAGRSLEPMGAQPPSGGASGQDIGQPSGPGVLEGHTVTLRLASVLGSAEMVWNSDGKTAGKTAGQP